jgi:hypothetical protein
MLLEKAYAKYVGDYHSIEVRDNLYKCLEFTQFSNYRLDNQITVFKY